MKDFVVSAQLLDKICKYNSLCDDMIIKPKVMKTRFMIDYAHIDGDPRSPCLAQTQSLPKPTVDVHGIFSAHWFAKSPSSISSLLMK